MSSIFNKESAVKLQKHYTIKNVAEICAVNEKSVYRWLYEGKLKAHKINGSVRVPRTAQLSQSSSATGDWTVGGAHGAVPSVLAEDGLARASLAVQWRRSLRGPMLW